MQHSQPNDIHISDKIQTYRTALTKRVATDPCLSLCGHWDQLVHPLLQPFCISCGPTRSYYFSTDHGTISFLACQRNKLSGSTTAVVFFENVCCLLSFKEWISSLHDLLLHNPCSYTAVWSLLIPIQVGLWVWIFQSELLVFLNMIWGRCCVVKNSHQNFCGLSQMQEHKKKCKTAQNPGQGS
jgi:hypothetical protein